MKVIAGPTRWPGVPVATPRPSLVLGRFPKCSERPHRLVCGSADPDALAADNKSGNSLQSALQSATELISSASGSVKQVLASPTEATEPPSQGEHHEQLNGSNGASSKRHGTSNPLDKAAKRLKLAAKAVTGGAPDPSEAALC